VRDDLEALLGVSVIEHFATSETGVISINFPPKRGSVGIPVIEHIKILDENGNSARPYEQGEIVVKGETVFGGYENAPDINKTVFFNGWFRTGDMGYIDDEGYLFLTGRKKEIINKGGEKIAPSEIDEVLLTCPGVRDVMTFMVNDPVLGEDIAAMVVRTEARVTEQELRMYLLDRIAPFKVPRKIYFTDAIPRNPAGKPLRHVGTKRYS
jgi:acyl-CoA synthetase (AMP-forming)/AMP-acid ligase II